MAFFGVSVSSRREARGDPAADSQLAAFCLRGMVLQWRKQVGKPQPICIFYCPDLRRKTDRGALAMLPAAASGEADGAKLLQFHFGAGATNRLWGAQYPSFVESVCYCN